MKTVFKTIGAILLSIYMGISFGRLVAETSLNGDINVAISLFVMVYAYFSLRHNFN